MSAAADELLKEGAELDDTATLEELEATELELIELDDTTTLEVCELELLVTGSPSDEEDEATEELEEVTLDVDDAMLELIELDDSLLEGSELAITLLEDAELAGTLLVELDDDVLLLPPSDSLPQPATDNTLTARARARIDIEIPLIIFRLIVNCLPLISNTIIKYY
ncbi:hypothetical protein [Gilvimarinus agarilyticus]|uniref:hypothetical protein n=1 Tax=Gilvimarinus agarilyticus TaxID=679259 RepID=UPI0018DD9A0D|nr:hypothetical protein [Gilvimarinus agarilyticus]